MEGRVLRDRAVEFAELGCVVLGASFDPPDDNRAFASAQQFNFRLLSDVDREVGAAYGVRRADDDQYAAFPLRVSYLIDPEGVVRRAYRVSDVGSHAGAVLADLRVLAT